MLLSRSLAFTITLVLIRTIVVVVVVVVVVNINFLPVAERNILLILLAVPAVILLVMPAVLAVLLLVLLVLLVLLTSQSFEKRIVKCNYFNVLFFISFLKEKYLPFTSSKLHRWVDIFLYNSKWIFAHVLFNS